MAYLLDHSCSGIHHLRNDQLDPYHIHRIWTRLGCTQCDLQDVDVHDVRSHGGVHGARDPRPGLRLNAKMFDYCVINFLSKHIFCGEFIRSIK